MKAEIGGIFKWSDKAKAYAAAFREGDAVKVKGDWHEVKRVENTNTISNVAPEDNPYNLNYRPDGEECYKGVAKGFLKSRVDSPYGIVTPKDYEVQEGDKLVRLGKTVERYSQSELTFGKVYEVVRWHEDGELVYKNDMTTALLASYLKEEDSDWGVIPRYENVKAEVFEVDYSGKFKVGDRVKVIATAFEDSGGDIGKFGIVTSISERYKHFASYLVEFDSGGDEHFNEAELELIERVEEKEEEEMNKKEECVGKFKEGDRVRVTGGYYNGWEGSISQSREVGGETACAVLFGNGRGLRWVEEEVLELVEKMEKSEEQEAFDYLLSQSKDETRNMLEREVALWAEVNLAHRKHDDLRRAINILEKLEKGE